MTAGRPRTTTPAGSRTKRLVQGTAVHLVAMHLSGALLVLTFLLPPTWALDAHPATQPGGPTAGPPCLVPSAFILVGVSFHVLVQIPSGLLSTLLSRHRTVRADYVLALALAGALTTVLLGVVLGSAEAALRAWPLWTELMARAALPLAVNVWLHHRLHTPPPTTP